MRTSTLTYLWWHHIRLNPTNQFLSTYICIFLYFVFSLFGIYLDCFNKVADFPFTKSSWSGLCLLWCHRCKTYTKQEFSSRHILKLLYVVKFLSADLHFISQLCFYCRSIFVSGGKTEQWVVSLMCKKNKLESVVWVNYSEIPPLHWKPKMTRGTVFMEQVISDNYSYLWQLSIHTN